MGSNQAAAWIAKTEKVMDTCPIHYISKAQPLLLSFIQISAFSSTKELKDVSPLPQSKSSVHVLHMQSTILLFNPTKTIEEWAKDKNSCVSRWKSRAFTWSYKGKASHQQQKVKDCKVNCWWCEQHILSEVGENTINGATGWQPFPCPFKRHPESCVSGDTQKHKASRWHAAGAYTDAANNEGVRYSLSILFREHATSISGSLWCPLVYWTRDWHFCKPSSPKVSSDPLPWCHRWCCAPAPQPTQEGFLLCPLFIWWRKE